MFDRTDVLRREEPTPATADKSARDAGPTVDQARQVKQRPGAPGQRPRSTATDPDDQHNFDGEDRAHRPTEPDRDRDRQAREQHRGWQGREAREGRPRAQPPTPARAEAYSRRHDSPEDAARYEQSRIAHLAGLDTQDRARKERAAQERDQLARERQARISEARARLDAAAKPHRRQDTPAAPVAEDRAQDRQARDDGRTWTEGRAWTDQDRAGIQRFTKDTPAPREETEDQRVIREYDERNAAREESNRRIELAAYKRTPYKYKREPRPAREQREAQPRTDGHRREYNAREAQPRDRRTRTDRDRDAIADVGMYRAVSYKDLSEQHYDNHPYVTRRAVTRMVRAGLIEEHEATGPQGNTFTVLTATQRGRDAAHRAALDAGHVPEQETWTGLVKPAELSHDTAVYRAALGERARIEAEGGRVVRVRLDAELKSLVATATEKARAEGGDRAAETAKAAAAQELGLPMKDGHVMYPDAQLEIEDSEGMSGRVNVEIASDHYHAAAIVAKAGAGFAMHGSSQSASRNIGRALGRAAARETDSGPGGGSGPGREGSVEL